MLYKEIMDDKEREREKEIKIRVSAFCHGASSGSQHSLNGGSRERGTQGGPIKWEAPVEL